MMHIKKGDLITMRDWCPEAFVRVCWVHHHEGLVSFIGIDNLGEPYARTHEHPASSIKKKTPTKRKG